MIRAKGSISSGGMHITADSRPLWRILWSRLRAFIVEYF